jgi:hydroxymethylpyrimidine kinase/phosphomethylpyrimidine kinase/thiamine-phosphate diphosphorylase
MSQPAIVWSVAGTDSGGGAGLAADLRAADAFGVHLCPVVAAVTAQHSRAVTHVEAMPPALIDAQLAALADDMPPAAIKTGLLGSAAQIAVVARWVDRLRDRHGALPLVVDPVLGASSGGSFADDATLRAYRELLLPRATLVTPNRREAAALVGDDDAVPALAHTLRTSARAVCVTGGDADDTLALDWLATEHAEGWLALPRIPTRHGHGTGCTFASSAAAALALGFVAADALVLAKMATTHALRHAREAGAGPGPVIAHEGFATDPSLLPQLSFGEVLPRFDFAPRAAASTIGLYAIVARAEQVAPVLAAGVRTVQLRIKAPLRLDAARQRELQIALADAQARCRAAGATLVVNDHHELAIELGAAVHLGQEDLLALGEAGRARLAASGVALGVSSHSLWELARARSLAPTYVACGPIWPTLTKAMPWHPQGADNLAWWCAMAGVPVVAIGGILSADQVATAARCGTDGVCLVRVLGDDPIAAVPPLAAALEAGRAMPRLPIPVLPHPSLGGRGLQPSGPRGSGSAGPLAAPAARTPLALVGEEQSAGTVPRPTRPA